MEKKKYKFNIIDAIILVLIICVAVFAVLKFSDGGSGAGAAVQQEKVIIRYYLHEAADYVVNATEVGDPVFDGTSEQDMGVVTAIETGEPQGYLDPEDPTSGYVRRENHCSILITTEAYGTWTDHGVVVGETIYAPGHSLVVYAGQGKYYMKVHSLERIGQ